MGSQGVPERPAPVELVHAGDRACVTRFRLHGRSVIRKQLRGPDAPQRQRRELGVLRRLRGVPGIAQLVDAPQYPDSVLVEDVGGTSLATRAKPLPAAELVPLAVKLARAVAGMHRRAVLHRDITPANIVLSPAGEPSLVDFGLATSSAELRPEFAHPREVVGTLAYVAPEQTGRTGRSVDHRADLYALGATLYELATGRPPFGFGDALRLTHDHLARVPTPPAEVDPTVPAPLSGVILHLLEKEPDNRYQTAEGLLHDLERVAELLARPAGPPLRIGEHDVPRRLLPLYRPVGREAPVAVLRAAFEDARAGGCRGLLISGAAGVGKTALADELRPIVNDGNGWFVTAAFDQYRRDRDDAMYRAFRALARRLLAEPEDELTQLRDRIVAALGPNAGLLSAIVPDLASLLQVPPALGDPLTVQARLQPAAVDLLHAIASAKRPVVVFLDNLHGAGRMPLGVADVLLSEQGDGLLLVGAYQEGDGTLARWGEREGVRQLRLEPLTAPDSVTMIAELLRTDRAPAAELVEVIDPHTRGNPAQIMDLLDALLRQGLLRPAADGWRWDPPVLRAHLDRSDTRGLLAARVDALPAPTRHLVEVMACLGVRAELTLLQGATGKSATAVDLLLAPALADGLVLIEPGEREAARFLDDRVPGVVLGELDPQRQHTLHLAMARRMALVAELEAAAAEQFLPVVGDLGDPGERQQVAGLLRRAAGQAALTGNHALVNGLLTGALQLIDPSGTAELIEVRTGRHAALFCLGALDEADAEYAAILRLPGTAAARAAASAVQVRSLTHRNRFAAAIELGLVSLGELGVAAPAPDRFAAELHGLLDACRRRLERGEELELPGAAPPPPPVLAAIRLVDATLPAAFFAGDVRTHGWLALQALRIWGEHGPGSGVSGAACSIGIAAVALHGDHAAGDQAVRRILARGLACGCDPCTAQIRFHAAVHSCWFGPIEDTVAAGRQARDELIAHGDVADAGYSYHLTVACLLDCAPTLDTCLGEAQEGLAFLRRAGNAQSLQWLDSYQWLADVLTGRIAASADEAIPSDTYAENPLAVLHGHLNRALAAAVLGHAEELTRHSAAAMPLLAMAPAFYPTVLARILRGLALAGQARAGTGPERAAPLAELAETTCWLADRAVDAPDNFLHLLRLLEAEQAWALGDFRAAVVAFDAARREVRRRQRPWHRALIMERAARFHLEHGLDGSAADLLAEARRCYADWGATAKVEQLDWAYPVLPRNGEGGRDEPSADVSTTDVSTTDLSTGTVDLLGLLAASRALSSQTSVPRLHARVAQVLGSITGATDVQLLLWNDERQDWRLPAADEDGERRPVGGADSEGPLPASVLRYVARTGETLVVADATRDDRFAPDPYFAGLDCCSLLALPIFGRGRLRAMLMLQSRLIRGAFTAQRLDGVRLVAGQLAVSLDNAQLYAESRRIAEEQATLRRVATLVARGATPDLVFATVAQEVGRLFRAELSAVLRFEPDGDVTVMGDHGVTVSGTDPSGKARADALTASVRVTSQPARWDAGDRAPTAAPEPEPRGVRSMAASPILVEGRVWGGITVGSHGDPLPADIEYRLADFTELIATAIANADSRAQLTASRARIIAAADQTRRRIERDLHDGAQQRLISLALQVRAAQAEVPPELAQLNAGLDRAVAEATEALDELRETARGIHPAVLKDGGLGAALRTLARRSPIPVELDLQTRERLPEPVEVSAYYVVAEALTNAAKHAQASGVTVTVQRLDPAGVLRLSIGDDGVGGADFDRGTGLLGLRDRVEALGGRVGLVSPRGAGTTLTVELPICGS